MKPPICKKSPRQFTQLGRTRVDPFAWLRDDDWKRVMREPQALAHDIRAHLDSENSYTRALMADSEALQATLFAEMKGRIKEDESTVPAPDGAFEYYLRYAPGAQHPVHARRPRGADAGEQVLLDADAAAKGHAYFDVGAAAHSFDHALYAYAVDTEGSEFYRIVLRDIAAGTDLPQFVENSSGDFVFSPDSRFLYWIWRNENGRSAKVYRRPARGGPDVLIYEEPDEGFFLGLDVTGSRAFIVITCGNRESSEAHLIPAADPEAVPVCFQARESGVRYDVDHWGDRFVILTNDDGAVDYKVMTCPQARTARAHWTVLIPHQKGRYIEAIWATKDYLARQERAEALPRLVLRDQAGAEQAIAFDEEAYALSLDPGFEHDTSILRFTYSSPTTPRQWVDYDMRQHTRRVRKTQEIPSGHDPSRYVARRMQATAADGASVPITLLMRADLKPNSATPVLLYGYGAYGISMEADFSIRRLSLVDRGWIWAIAHVRGGADKGWGWFLDGRAEKKTNTFADFIACAEALIAAGVTGKGRIAAYGGSAGGMLMGAVANMRPDLFGAVIAAVPFVDVLNTMSDDTLPLTPPEWPEWGDPLHDPAAYDRIAAYSPYENVAALAYPPILATGGLTDPRVTYWEPAKWIAQLRDRSPQAGPYLLKINMEAGHGGASGRYDFLKEIALDYAFALKALGDPLAGAPMAKKG